MHHEAPTCAGWRDLMASSHAEQSGALIVTDLGRERIKPKRKG
jgi:hypothetical protein